MHDVHSSAIPGKMSHLLALPADLPVIPASSIPLHLLAAPALPLPFFPLCFPFASRRRRRDPHPSPLPSGLRPCPSRLPCSSEPPARHDPRLRAAAAAQTALQARALALVHSTEPRRRPCQEPRVELGREGRELTRRRRMSVPGRPFVYCKRGLKVHCGRRRSKGSKPPTRTGAREP